MKKLFFSALILGLAFTTSCSSDDDSGRSCEDLSRDYLAAFEAYTNDTSVENCNAFRASLQAFIDNDCAGGQEATLQAQLDDLDCN
ncbi:hypothetical protein [Aequorivita echinoideorum]|uniref:Lipoprotein n=1 Tax=Aequorivita echinoideorum TaxID=1549647 RepID=A0ABS5S1M4_9FLAO|nr:hypothetical protein [Aequorivita echinoideorum]MBT0607115.1 hypothetical protein [Aequorivita echinoideorum]